uniref:Uncharacterized protein n=1 Tax=Cannabis sativa TaxID=3483 RepID=A0A803QRG3_CANSA
MDGSTPGASLRCMEALREGFREMKCKLPIAIENYREPWDLNLDPRPARFNRSWRAAARVRVNVTAICRGGRVAAVVALVHQQFQCSSSGSRCLIFYWLLLRIVEETDVQEDRGVSREWIEEEARGERKWRRVDIAKSQAAAGEEAREALDEMKQVKSPEEVQWDLEDQRQLGDGEELERTLKMAPPGISLATLTTRIAGVAFGRYCASRISPGHPQGVTVRPILRRGAPIGSGFDLCREDLSFIPKETVQNCVAIFTNGARSTALRGIIRHKVSLGSGGQSLSAHHEDFQMERRSGAEGANLPFAIEVKGVRPQDTTTLLGDKRHQEVNLTHSGWRSPTAGRKFAAGTLKCGSLGRTIIRDSHGRIVTGSSQLPGSAFNTAPRPRSHGGSHPRTSGTGDSLKKMEVPPRVLHLMFPDYGLPSFLWKLKMIPEIHLPDSIDLISSNRRGGGGGIFFLGYPGTTIKFTGLFFTGPQKCSLKVTSSSFWILSILQSRGGRGTPRRNQRSINQAFENAGARVSCHAGEPVHGILR